MILRNQIIFFGRYAYDTDTNILTKNYSFEYRLKGSMKLKRLRTTALENALNDKFSNGLRCLSTMVIPFKTESITSQSQSRYAIQGCQMQNMKISQVKK